MNGNFNVLYIYIYICKIIQYSSLFHRIKNFNSFTQVKFRFPLTHIILHLGKQFCIQLFDLYEFKRENEH